MSLEDKTIAELKEMAKAEDVNLHGHTKKADIIHDLEEAGVADPASAAPEAPAGAEDTERESVAIKPKQKPTLDDATTQALAAREAKKDKQPAFRRHEWWRYKRLGGKNASWRRPRGIHSKQRRHFGWRPPVVSIGYRGPVAARGLHPSGFEEVLVHRPEDLTQVDPKTQAARVGGTVGGRKAERIEKEADKLGIRILNRRNA